MKKRRKYGFLLLCLSALFVLPFPALAEKAEPETIRVGWYEDSYHTTGANGERSGYGYEYEQAVAGYTGWNYEYIKGDWAELLEMLQSGKIDLMAALSYTDERAETMLFSELPMGREKYEIYVDLANTDISAADLSTLNGKRIVVMEKSVQGTQFAQWEEKHNVHTQHLDIDSFARARQMAEERKIDGVVSTETPAWVEAGMSAVATIGGSDVYYGISKNRPDLKEKLDSAMRRMEYDKPFYADELYRRYLSAQSVAVLSGGEKAWLEQHGVIRLGWVKDDIGVSSMDAQSGELTGVLCDYVAYAADCLGNQTLEFELHGFDTQEAEIQALKDGKIDAIFHVSQSPYAAEQNGFSLSNTAWTYHLAAITAKERFHENEENRVAVIGENEILKWFLSYYYPHWQIVEFDSTKEIDRAVLDGQVDCFVTSAGQVSPFLKNHKLHSVFLMQSGNASFAVKRGNSVLLSVLNKTLKTMPASMLTGAVSMYDNAPKKVTLTEFVKDNLLPATAVFASLFLVVLAVILGLLRRSRAAEARAKEAMAQAERANAAKSNFLFNMSHDIRTPMNAILGFAALAEKNPDTPQPVQDYLRKIQVSGEGMLSILDNVLEFSRIESGKMVLEETPQVAGKVFDSCMVMMNPEIEKRHHTVTVEKEIQCPYLFVDAPRVTEIILNLMSNAIKYTADGGKIHCALRQSAHPKEGWIYQQITVSDNGIGMSEEFQQHIFETFARERSSTASGVQGTGLGMGIVKKLVDLMGGTISVSSKPGEGTTVSVRIPVRIASYEDTQPKRSTTPAGAERLRGKRILLAEDNDLNAEIAIALLEEEGLQVDRAVDGVQCVEKMERCAPDCYALILMDVQMPFLDGYQATKKIRLLQDKKKANIPIIAMTANAFSEDKARALETGMNDHVAKPIDMDILVGALLKYL